MLIRCPDCKKLYPAHHNECRNCKLAPSAVALPPLGNAAPKPQAKDDDEQDYHFLMKKNKSSQSLPESTPDLPVAPPPAAISMFEAPTELERTEIPTQKAKTGPLGMWNPIDGGLCPQCKSVNPTDIPFCAICGIMLLKSDSVDIITSYDLNELKGLIPAFIQKLGTLGIHSTEDILRTCASSKKNRDIISSKVGMSERSLLRLVHAANFCRMPSFTPNHAAMLELIAITTLEELLKLSADKVYQKIQQAKMVINKQGILILPTRKQIQQWFDEARDLAPIKIQ